MTRYFLTGATGLTGQVVLRELLARDPEAHCVCTIRTESASPRLVHERVSWVNCDVGDAGSLETAFETAGEVDEVIHLVQLRHVPRLINVLARQSSRPRLVVVGTTGMFSRYQSYAQEYLDAEARLREAYPHHVVLRPTMIYGAPSDKNLHKLIRFIDRYGCFPLFGRGTGLLQPIHYEDLAVAILAVVAKPELSGRAYNLSGGTVITYRDLLDLVARLLGRPFLPLPVPIRPGASLARLAEGLATRVGRQPPVREEQVLRLLEDKHFDHAEASRELGFAPRSLEEGLEQEIEAMRRDGLIRARRAG